MVSNQRGFSIVETIFAAVIAGIIVLFLTGQISMMSSKSKELRAMSESTDRGSMGVRFSLLVEFAEASAYFSHLPVPVSCASEKAPCLRVLDPATGDFVSAGSQFANVGRVSFVEFFRDDVGEVKNDNKVFTKAGDDIYYSSTPPLDLSQQKKDVYVTWPLVDETSPAFPIMHRLGLTAYFSMDGALATSSPKDSYALLMANGLDPSEGDIAQATKGRLVILYNSNDVKHFSVMKIMDIKQCSETDPFCKTLVPAGYVLSGKNFAVKMSKVEASELRNFIPDYTKVSNSAPSNWRDASDIYIFPTGSSTLYKAGDRDISSGEIDIRTWTHFYHASSLKGEVIVLPVELTSYKLVKNQTDKSYKLVKETFGDAAGSYQVEIDKVTGPIYLARKLGTKTVSAFVGEAL